jgi:hypothetical protein
MKEPTIKTGDFPKTAKRAGITDAESIEPRDTKSHL